MLLDLSQHLLLWNNEKKGAVMFQFAHIDSYSRVTPKVGKTGSHSVKSIVAEASRIPGSYPHVVNPQAPVYLYGAPLSELESACNFWADTLKDARGHKIRKDALCLLAGVISAPAEIDPKSWEKVKADSISWLHRKYGERLQTVVEHLDESNPHIHFYCVPLAGERFDQIHDGKKAVSALKGRTKGEQNAAYRQAMRGWQDEFSADVGVLNGMSRFGPRKRRLSRAAWKQEQHTQEQVAASLAASQELAATASSQAAEVLQAAKSEAVTLHRKTIKTAELEVLHNFAQKSVLGRLVEMITKFSKENTRLELEAREQRNCVNNLVARLGRYQFQAGKYLGILKSVRPKFKELTETVGHLRIVNRSLRDELGSERNTLSNVENKLSRALATIESLQAEIEPDDSSENDIANRSALVRKHPRLFESGMIFER